MKMGGVTLNNAGLLANTLKSKVSELDIRSRLEPTANMLLQHEYGKPTLRELAPGRRRAVNIKATGSQNDPRYSLNVLAGTWKDSGIRMPENNANADVMRNPVGFQNPGAGQIATINQRSMGGIFQ